VPVVTWKGNGTRSIEFGSLYSLDPSPKRSAILFQPGEPEPVTDLELAVIRRDLRREIDAGLLIVV
jgi:hypothetical protein